MKPSIPQLTGAKQQLPPLDVSKDKLGKLKMLSSNKQPFQRGVTKPEVVRRTRGTRAQERL